MRKNHLVGWLSSLGMAQSDFRIACRITFLLIFMVGMTATFYSCSKSDIDVPSIDNPKPEEIDTVPKFQYTKEKVYLFDVKLYSDVMHFFKYKTTVKQTNPNSSVSLEYLKQMEDSINSIVDHPFYWDEITISDIGFDINDYELSNFKLRFSAFKGDGDEGVTSKYSKFGRDSIINLFNRQNIHGEFIAYDDRPTTFSPRISVDFRQNPVGIETGDDILFEFCDSVKGYSTDIEVPANSSFNIPIILQKPEMYPNLHALVYDRFNEREYECEDGTKYKTLVVVKRLTDMKDFDASAPYPYKPDLTKTYPVMQFYKNEELWLEGWVDIYAEEFDYNRQEDRTTTCLKFDCNTLKNGYHYVISYKVGRRLEVHIRDFSKPSEEDSDMTLIDTQIINFINDRKANAKATISIE